MKSGVAASKYDRAISIWHCGNKWQDIIAVHVDDFCFAGSEIFNTRVIKSFCHVLAVKPEEVAEFQFIRLDIGKKGEHIKLWQNEYFKKFQYIPVETTRNLEDTLSTTEITETRLIIDQTWSKVRCECIKLHTKTRKGRMHKTT